MWKKLVYIGLLATFLIAQVSQFPAGGGGTSVAEDLTTSCSDGQGIIAASGAMDCGSVGSSLTNQFQPITRWMGPDGIGYVWPGIALNVGNDQRIQTTHDALWTFAAETTAILPDPVAGSRRMFVDARDRIRSDFASAISLKAWVSSDAASGNYRYNAYFTDYADGDSVMLPEVLTETDFATTVNWTAAGDWACGSGTCTYTHSTGSGTLTQASGAFATTSKANMYYNFGYTTSAVAGGGPTCTITTAFALAAETLNVDENATTYQQFVSAAAPGDFVISCTSGASDAITVDNFTLRNVFEQVVQLTSAAPTTANELKVIELTPATPLNAGQLLRVRFELDYVNAANTADGAMHLWETGLEGNQ